MSNNSYAEQNTIDDELDIFKKIFFPYNIIISTIGICGNFITIVMLSKRSISKNFNNCTLIALALTDLLFNFMLVSRCIIDFTQSNDEYFCRLLAFLSHLAELLSACFTAQFTAQRFIAVRFPLSVFIEKKIHLMHYLVVTLFIIFGIIYCFGLVQKGHYEQCQEELGFKWFLSDALLSFLLPLITITILNILIIVHLKKGFQNNQQFHFTKRQQQLEILPLSFRKRNSMSHDSTSNRHFQRKTSGNIIISHSKGTVLRKPTNDDLLLSNGRVRSLDLLQRPSLIRSKTQSYRVTRMLILVSTCFLLLNAPFHICTIGLTIYPHYETTPINNSNQTPIKLHDNFKQHNHTSFISTNNIDLTPMIRKASNQNDITNDSPLWRIFYIILFITQHISYASYSINFFLYSFCGIKFRRELIRFMSKRRQQKTRSRSITVQNII